MAIKDQEFEIVDISDNVRGKTHSFHVFIQYPFKRELVGYVKWQSLYYGYAFEACSFGTICPNVFREILQLVDDLNNGRENKYIEPPFDF